MLVLLHVRGSTSLKVHTPKRTLGRLFAFVTGVGGLKMESRLGRLNALADPMANPKRRGVTAFIVGTVLERGEVDIVS